MRMGASSDVSSFRALILWDQGPTLMTSFNLNYFLILFFGGGVGE